MDVKKLFAVFLLSGLFWIPVTILFMPSMNDKYHEISGDKVEQDGLDNTTHNYDESRQKFLMGIKSSFNNR